MQNSSLISFIVPCYNQAQFLDETLLSIFAQTYENWECIIVNDESPDSTEEIAQKWVAKDHRFKYHFKQNGGVSSTRNFGLEKAQGEYIQFLDADDLIANNKLQLSLQIINESTNKNVQIVFTNFKMFTTNVKNTEEPFCNLNDALFSYENLLYKWNEAFSIPIHTALIKTSLIANVRFPENMTAQEDWIFWVNLFKNRPRIIFIDKPLAYYRRNISGRTQSMDMLEDQLKAYEYFKNFLTEEEFHKMSLVLISRYYRKSGHFVHEYSLIKNTNTYKTGNFIKKTLRKLRLLNFAKSLLRIIKF